MWDTWTWILNNWGMWRKGKWKVMPRMQSAMTMIVRVRSRIEMTCSIRLNHNCDIFGDSGCAGNWISNIINLLSIDDTLKLIGRLEKEWQLLISKVSHWPELHWSRILKIKGYKGYKFSYPACLSSFVKVFFSSWDNLPMLYSMWSGISVFDLHSKG